jgi:hypothetical protein
LEHPTPPKKNFSFRQIASTGLSVWYKIQKVYGYNLRHFDVYALFTEFTPSPESSLRSKHHKKKAIRVSNNAHYYPNEKRTIRRILVEFLPASVTCL